MAGSDNNNSAVALACTGVAVAGGAWLMWHVVLRRPTKPDNIENAVNLPYFDVLLAKLDDESDDRNEQQRHGLRLAFGRHVHWGYWPDPTTARFDDAADFAAAAEQLCRVIVDGQHNNNAHLPPQRGEHILDVGCGFGGTIASLNERYNRLTLTGLNIDERQLERARRLVKPIHDNSITFVQGDACNLTGLTDASFDMVSAVECIFHFPDRDRFFAEARLVLKPGTRLVLSDFVLADWLFGLLTGGGLWSNEVVLHDATYGDIRVTSLSSYRRLAARHGFTLTSELDVTVHTLPTYPVVAYMQGLDVDNDGARNAATTAKLEWLARRGWVRYMVYRFDVSSSIENK
jgi:SAM-dependent methyltransferase